jgi:tagaturonate reductase
MLSDRLGQPILQFGTSRFLQAHVDLFVSEALDADAALGGITVVQTTDSDESAARVAAMAGGAAFPIHIRGLLQGRRVVVVRTCRAVRAALRTATQWSALRREMAEGDVRVIVSNTGDAGWRLDVGDGRSALGLEAPAPASFPAKLLVLLYGRWQARPPARAGARRCAIPARTAAR